MAAVGDVYEMRMYSTFGTQTAINVRHYLCSAKAGAGASEALIANTFGLTVGPDMKPLMCSLASWRGVGVHRLIPAPPGLETFDTGTFGPGTATGDALPKQVSGIITLRTLFSGRRFRGRIYIPFAAEADNAATSIPSAGYLTRLGTLAADLLLTLNPGVGGNTNSFIPCVYSRLTQVATPISSFLARPVWATQRKRGDYGRLNPSPI